MKSVALVNATVGRIEAISREGLGCVPQHEDLPARHTDRAESELPRLPRHADHRLRGQRPPVRDGGHRLRQAVAAREVAVVGRIEPEPISAATFGDSGLERLGGAHAVGGTSKAVQ